MIKAMAGVLSGTAMLLTVAVSPAVAQQNNFFPQIVSDFDQRVCQDAEGEAALKAAMGLMEEIVNKIRSVGFKPNKEQELWFTLAVLFEARRQRCNSLEELRKRIKALGPMPTPMTATYAQRISGVATDVGELADVQSKFLMLTYLWPQVKITPQVTESDLGVPFYPMGVPPGTGVVIAGPIGKRYVLHMIHVDDPRRTEIQDHYITHLGAPVVTNDGGAAGQAGGAGAGQLGAAEDVVVATVTEASASEVTLDLEADEDEGDDRPGRQMFKWVGSEKIFWENVEGRGWGVTIVDDYLITESVED